MFEFFSKGVYLADIMAGFHDVHCHLLPGVDDGSPSAERSAELLGELESLGMQAAYLTPHIINGAYDNRDEETLRAEFAKFKQAPGYDGAIRLSLGAEYFVDDRLMEHIAARPLAMKDNHVLCEFSMNSFSERYFDILFEVAVQGYTVILAHPERYAFMAGARGERFETAMRHIADGAYRLQLNLLSLTGYHGDQARRTAEKFLDADRYTFIGSDIHSKMYIDTLKASKVPAKLFPKLQRLADNNRMLF